MANVISNSLKGQIGNGGVDWNTDTIKVALVTSAYTPDIDAHSNFTTHITNETIGSTGYTTGGETITTPAVTIDTTDDWAEYTCDNITWGSSTITARGAVVYQSTSGDLISYVDFTTDKTSSDGDFTITWHADGVFKLA